LVELEDNMGDPNTKKEKMRNTLDGVNQFIVMILEEFIVPHSSSTGGERIENILTRELSMAISTTLS
jgi:hypothetical protein